MIENITQLKDDYNITTFGELTMNEYAQMVSDLAKPGEDIIKSLTPALVHTLHMAVGLSGEVGELKDAHLESLVTALTHVERQANDENILEEFGDIEFYFTGLCRSMGMDMETSNPSTSNILSIDRLVVNAGLMLDIVKKMVIYNKEIPLMDFVNQLITVRTVLDQTYKHFAVSPENARQANMTKLLKGKNARYAEGVYSDKAAQDRADKV